MGTVSTVPYSNYSVGETPSPHKGKGPGEGCGALPVKQAAL